MIIKDINVLDTLIRITIGIYLIDDDASNTQGFELCRLSG